MPPKRPEIEGKNMLEVGALLGKTPVDAALDTIVEQGGAASAIYFVMGEDDVRAIMGHRAGMVGSDSVPVPPQVRSHPRVNGTFPRVLGKYVREERVLTLEDAVRKMTSFPARWFGLTGKGLVAEGMDADLVVFDPAAVIDTATYDEPSRAPLGIDYVFVNGVMTMIGTEATGRRAGQVLRRGR
jgi:N-acyl-D-amino-acid deacylase